MDLCQRGVVSRPACALGSFGRGGSIRKVITILPGSIRVIALFASAASGPPLGFVGPIYDGPEPDYQPAILRTQPSLIYLPLALIDAD